MTATFDLKQRLNEMRLSPKRAFGQNFLVSPRVIAAIVEAVKTRPHADLVEVGPGLGALTEPLIAAGLKPHLIEFDADLVEYWQTRDLEVTAADALKLDWNTLALKPKSLLVSNLPYNISTSLIVDRCFGPLALDNLILMFQREVAERLVAKPRGKDYGLLSVVTQLHFEMKKVVDASPRDFYPAPRVSSRVLSFARRPDPGLGLPFLKFAKGAFAFRRKFLLKNLRAVVDKSKYDAMPKALAELGFNEKARAEELTPEHFASLFRALR